jgi:hypothetical protein
MTGKNTLSLLIPYLTCFKAGRFSSHWENLPPLESNISPGFETTSTSGREIHQKGAVA